MQIIVNKIKIFEELICGTEFIFLVITVINTVITKKKNQFH